MKNTDVTEGNLAAQLGEMADEGQETELKDDIVESRTALKAVSDSPEQADEEDRILKELTNTVESIEDSETLKNFCKDCAQHDPKLLNGGVTENGFWVKPYKGYKDSEALVEVINKQKAKLAKKEKEQRYLDNHLEKIDSITNRDDLRKYLGTLKYHRYIKIGFNGEPIADDRIFGSKKIVQALNKKRESLIKEEENLKERKKSDSVKRLVAKYKK
ncbi:hypothetical protein JW758_00545 [Candidatus Peregrinibacteria bacterium]|nr:hypothetical protein [Candidatus Peregrinibacteria bacterium]